MILSEEMLERISAEEYWPNADGSRKDSTEKYINMYKRGERFEIGKRAVMYKLPANGASDAKSVADAINESRIAPYRYYTERFVELYMGIGLIEIENDVIYVMRPYNMPEIR